MKQLILTGLATEHNFGGEGEQYYLVFNKGDLRVPITESAAEIVIKEMYGKEPATPEVREDTHQTNGNGYQISEVGDIDGEKDEAGVGQV